MRIIILLLILLLSCIPIIEGHMDMPYTISCRLYAMYRILYSIYYIPYATYYVLYIAYYISYNVDWTPQCNIQ